MAGLPEYLGMGAAVAAIYIGVKYGGQIVHNLQGAQPAQATTPGDQTSTTPSTQLTPTQGNQVGGHIEDPIPNLTYAPETAGTPTAVLQAAQRRGARPVPGHINPVAGDETLDTGTDTHTYPQSIQKHAATKVPIPTPSNGPHVAPTPHKYPHHGHPHSKNCVCTSSGVYKAYPGQHCALEGQDCVASAQIGYWNGYETGWTGPQWRKTIPYRQVIASQGMLRQGRVKRALAAGNHEFIPAGFTLSESSVRRGYNNVYSAGT